MKKYRPIARAIIILDDKIALLERHRQGKRYFVFPGGGIDHGETPEQAAIRETLEETGLEIAIERLVAEFNFRGNLEYFFLSRPVGGQLGTGTGAEITNPSPSSGTYHPRWVFLPELPGLPVLPEPIVALAAGHPDWPESVLYFAE
jgi:8-oxo-dGTP pyrophosphatase MutT (NUDIX family)